MLAPVHTVQQTQATQNQKSIRGGGTRRGGTARPLPSLRTCPLDVFGGMRGPGALLVCASVLRACVLFAWGRGRGPRRGRGESLKSCKRGPCHSGATTARWRGGGRHGIGGMLMLVARVKPSTCQRVHTVLNGNVWFFGGRHVARGGSPVLKGRAGSGRCETVPHVLTTTPGTA